MPVTNICFDSIITGTINGVGVMISLHTADPGFEGNSEVSGGGYARTYTTLISGNKSNLVNAAPAYFPEATANWGSISHFMLRRQTDDAILGYGMLNDVVQVDATDILRFEVGQINLFASPVPIEWLADVAFTNNYDDLDNLPTLGTASEYAIEYFATASQGAKADTALQSAVGGTSCEVDNTDPQNIIINFTGTGTGDLIAANNLSDLTDADIARSHLGFPDNGDRYIRNDWDGLPRALSAIRSANLDSWSNGNPEENQGRVAPFGRGGVRVLIGEDNDAHYFGAGWNYFPDTGLTLLLFRKGSNHGTRNGAAIVAADSYDRGQTIQNIRIIYTHPDNDARPGSLALMDNGRVGLMVGRAREVGNPYDPLFLYSDDQGTNWTTVTMTRPEGSTAYAFVTGQPLVNLPADQGGGPSAFVAFGSMNAGTSLDAAKTTDNGASWTWVMDCTGAMPPEITRYSEHDVMVLTGGRWLFYFRNIDASTGTWRNEAIVTKVTDLLNWPSPLINTGVLISGSPPCTFVDYNTNMAYFLVTSRNTQVNYNLTNWALLVGADADDLWDADGDFAALNKPVQKLMPMPDWYTSYCDANMIDDTWYFMCTAGETNNADISLLCWVGDFNANGADASRWQDYLKTRIPKATSIHLFAPDNLATTYVIDYSNLSESLLTGFGPYGMSNKIGTSQSTAWTMNIGGALVVNATGVTFTFSGSSNISGVNYVFDLTGWVEANKIRPTGSTTTLQINEAGDLLNILGSIEVGTHPAYTTLGWLKVQVPGSTSSAIVTATSSASSRMHHVVENPNGVVGSITSLNLTTAFNVSSDENWKIFHGYLDPVVALAIIRGDPVRNFEWIANGEMAVGWGAQTSYNVSHDLATPGGWKDPVSGEEWEEGESRWVDGDNNPSTEGAEGAREITALYVPWGIDQSKRTPYLWAVTAYLADRVDTLEATVDTLNATIASLVARIEALEAA